MQRCGVPRNPPQTKDDRLHGGHISWEQSQTSRIYHHRPRANILREGIRTNTQNLGRISALTSGNSLNLPGFQTAEAEGFLDSLTRRRNIGSTGTSHHCYHLWRSDCFVCGTSDEGKREVIEVEYEKGGKRKLDQHLWWVRSGR